MWVGGLCNKSPPGQKEAVGRGRSLIPFGGLYFHILNIPPHWFSTCTSLRSQGPFVCVGRAIPQNLIETLSHSVDTTEGPPLPAVSLVKLVKFSENTYPIGAQAKLDGQKHISLSTCHVIEVEWRKRLGGHSQLKAFGSSIKRIIINSST